PDRVAVDVDPDAAVEDHEELRARRALPRQDLAGRDVDLFGQLADLLDVVFRQVLETRHALHELELVAVLCHLSLSDGRGRPGDVRAAYRLRTQPNRDPVARLHLASARSARSRRGRRPMPESPTPPTGSDPAKRHSAALTDGPDRAGARAMLKAIGFTDEDLAKRLVGVATTWIETMPCNYNQRRLADCVKEGIRAAGGTPMEFNTISVSDGVTMGTEGMKASLISREVIADSIELVVRGHLLDGLVCLTGCDKTMPGAAMAMARLDVPSLALYNGTIYPGMYKGRTVDVVSVYEAIGAYRAGKISLDELTDIENVACPGAGACGGQYTANTMSIVLEFLGLSPGGLNGIPAED